MKTVGIGIVIDNDKILLVNRKFPPKVWAPPGGYLDPGETIEEAVVREIWEETGVKCEVKEKIHDFIYEHEYGKSHINVYACTYISGELSCSFESLDVKWFYIDHLPDDISPEKEVFINARKTIQKI